MTEPSWARSLDAHLASRRKADAGRVADLWSRGNDTLAIAEAMSLPEPYVCLLLAEMQDERHAARQAARGGTPSHREAGAIA